MLSKFLLLSPLIAVEAATISEKNSDNLTQIGNEAHNWQAYVIYGQHDNDQTKHAYSELIPSSQLVLESQPANEAQESVKENQSPIQNGTANEETMASIVVAKYSPQSNLTKDVSANDYSLVLLAANEIDHKSNLDKAAKIGETLKAMTDYTADMSDVFNKVAKFKKFATFLKFLGPTATCLQMVAMFLPD